ncbi:MAG TPA: MFS transporter [Bordetella sp.]
MPASAPPLSQPMDARPERATLRAWLAVLALAVGCFAFVSSEMLPIGLLGPIAAGLHLPLGVAGLLVTGFAVMVALTAGPMTVLTGRIDRRRLMVLLMLASLAGNALAAVSRDFATLLVARLIVALAIGVFWSIATAMAVRLVPERQAVSATSVVLGGLAVAAVLGVPMGTLIGQYAGWHTAFAALSLLSLLVGMAALLLLPPMPAQSAGSLRAIADAFGHDALRTVFYATALTMTGNFLAYTYVTAYLQDVAGIPSHWMSALLLVYGVAGVAGNFSVGAAMQHSLRGALLGVLALLAASLLLLWAAGTNRIAAIALLVPWGIGYAALPVLLQTWVFRAARETGDAEAALSLFVMAFNAAIALGALLGGLVVDHAGPRAPMLYAGLLVAAAWLLVARSRRTAQISAWPQ